MIIIFKILVFFVGMYLCMRMIAALYSIIDFRYTIRTAYPRVIRGILIWGIITACIIILLGQYQNPLFWGMVIYIFIYLFSYLPNRLRLIKQVRSVDIEQDN